MSRNVQARGVSTQTPLNPPAAAAAGNSKNIPTSPPAIPLGHNGRPIKPAITDDGKLIFPPAPRDEKGHILPPPPIYGPDGKLLCRPSDMYGKQLPVYVTEEGQAILDREGNPIPLRFDGRGRPMPLEITQSASSYKLGVRPPTILKLAKRSLFHVPFWFKIIAFCNVIFSLAIITYTGFAYHTSLDDRMRVESGSDLHEESAKSAKSGNSLLATLVLSILGMFIGLLNCCAKKSLVTLCVTWVSVTSIFFVAHIVTKLMLESNYSVVIVGTIYSGARFCLSTVISIVTFFARSDREKREAQLYIGEKYNRIIDLEPGGGGEFGTGGYPIPDHFNRSGSRITSQTTLLDSGNKRYETVAMPRAYPMIGYQYPQDSEGPGRGINKGDAIYSPFYDYGWGCDYPTDGFYW